MAKPRVLIIAEAANPDWVSVPLIGWSLSRALRDVADVHVVTQVRNREAILRAGWIEGQDFTAIDSEAVARRLWKIGDVLKMGDGKGWTALQAVAALSYYDFERRVWRQFAPDLRAGRYDLVHRITPLSPTTPSTLAARCRRIGVPFVLGPLNGGVPWPPSFEAERRREREWLSYLRSAYRLLPGRAGMLKSAAAIIAGSRHTASEIPARFQDKLVYLPENGIDPQRFTGTSQAGHDKVAACFVGRLVPYKGPDMLLEAAAPLLRDGRMTLDIVGDGPMMPKLRTMAEDLGDAVRFHGWLAHQNVQTVMKSCNLLSFPSIREFGGGVVLEAMALGIVPLIVDYAGPGELVDDTVGRKVPIGTRDDIIAGFRQELARIAEDPSVLAPLAAAAKSRVEADFIWPRKAAQITEIYRWALGETAHKPDFFPR